MNRTCLFTDRPYKSMVRVIDQVFTPDNRAVESLLDTGDDMLPNTLSLMKNPLYATALQDFAKTLETSSRFSNLTTDQLFESINFDKDLNNNFWSFVDASEKYQSLLKENS